METAHSGFVQSQGTLVLPICDEEPSPQIPQPAVDLASNVLDEECSTIESYTGENEFDSNCDVANSDVESFNLSETNKSIQWAGQPLPMKDSTARRPLRNIVQNERSADEMWSRF